MGLSGPLRGLESPAGSYYRLLQRVCVLCENVCVGVCVRTHVCVCVWVCVLIGDSVM